VALPVDPGEIRVDAVRDRYCLSALGPDHAVGLLAERAAQLRECVTEAGARAVLAHIRPQPAERDPSGHSCDREAADDRQRPAQPLPDTLPPCERLRGLRCHLSKRWTQRSTAASNIPAGMSRSSPKNSSTKSKPCSKLTNHAGERDRTHQHYLKGTIRCGTCGCRLVYSQNNGNGGMYEYFVCPRYQYGECPQGYQPVDIVETAIENHYHGVTITEAERQEIREAITIDLGGRAATTQREIDRCHGVLEEVREQERKLLNMHYEDRITDELFDDEQARLRHRRQDAETLIDRLNLSFDDITETLDLALEILSEDLHDLYQRADDTVRRLLNQALQVPLRLRGTDHRRRTHRAIRHPARPARRHPPAPQQHPVPGAHHHRQHTPPQRQCSRPQPGTGAFGRWFD
jgi:Recombinase zinc beta ribbon domain